MELPEKTGMSVPMAFLWFLAVFITTYTGFMFYIEEEFVYSLGSFGVAMLLAWIVLDRSVF